jgi:hypothetical protein
LESKFEPAEQSIPELLLFIEEIGFDPIKLKVTELPEMVIGDCTDDSVEIPSR